MNCHWRPSALQGQVVVTTKQHIHDLLATAIWSFFIGALSMWLAVLTWGATPWV